MLVHAVCRNCIILVFCSYSNSVPYKPEHTPELLFGILNKKGAPHIYILCLKGNKKIRILSFSIV